MYRFIAAATSALMTFCLTASVMASNCGNNEPGRSESQIGQEAADSETGFLEEHYNLRHGFTEAEFLAAAGKRAVETLRINYNLGADFTALDFKRQAGARRAQTLLRQYSQLKPQFTMRQLAEQSVLEYISHLGLHLKPAFSFDDYARAASREASHFLGASEKLPDDFTYADIVRILGPLDAGRIRAQSGFSKHASHEEIVTAVGLAEARTFASTHQLKEGFAAQELADRLLYEEADRIEMEYGLDADASEAQFAAVLGQHELEGLVDGINSSGVKQPLTMAFTASDYAKAAGEQVVSNERLIHDLDPGFTEADYAASASALAQARERNEYHLQPGFSAEDDAKARTLAASDCSCLR